MDDLELDYYFDRREERNNKTAEYRFIEYVHENKLWNFLLSNCEFDFVTQIFKDEFYKFWIERGMFVRKQINNDELLRNLLRKLLPPYQGEEITLYRGENIKDYRKNRIGFCWNSDLKIAKRFSTRNAYNNSKLILSGRFDKDSIITKIHSQDDYMDESEYIIDPFKITNITIIEI